MRSSSTDYRALTSSQPKNLIKLDTPQWKNGSGIPERSTSRNLPLLERNFSFKKENSLEGLVPQEWVIFAAREVRK